MENGLRKALRIAQLHALSPSTTTYDQWLMPHDQRLTPPSLPRGRHWIHVGFHMMLMLCSRVGHISVSDKGLTMARMARLVTSDAQDASGHWP